MRSSASGISSATVALLAALVLLVALRRRITTRLIGAALLSLVMIVLVQQIADPPGPTDYQSEVTAIEPPAAGIEVESLEAVGVEQDVDFIVGTFSKSLGSVGGFCTSSHPQLDNSTP